MGDSGLYCIRPVLKMQRFNLNSRVLNYLKKKKYLIRFRKSICYVVSLFVIINLGVYSKIISILFVVHLFWACPRALHCSTIYLFICKVDNYAKMFSNTLVGLNKIF
jgi:hypothetical protein